MLLSLIVYIIPYILGIVLLVALINIFFHFRRASTAPYFSIRKDAGRRGWQWMGIAFVGAVSITLALFARRSVPPFDPAQFQLFGPDSTPLPTLAPLTSTPADNPLLNDTPLPPTITPTLDLTPTEQATPLIATIESNVEVPANATLTITEISSGITSDRSPLNAATEFPVGTQRVYFWLEFANMVNGLSWSQVLLLNGAVVRSESEAWSQGAEGTAFYWFEAQGGWPGGRYEIQFYLGDRLAASATFAIID